MRLLYLVIALTLAATALGQGCRQDYVDVNGRCFRYESHKRKYEDAQEDCRSEGAELAWIGDFTETLEILDALDLDKDFWIGAKYVEEDGEDYIVRQGRQRYPINEVGFWGSRQPKIKRDYECVLVKRKKGKKGHRGRGKGRHSRSNEGLEWELKKCKDKKSYLCEQRCDAGQTYCGGIGCVPDITECYETPPLFPCNVEHDFSPSGIGDFQSTGYPNRYPANGNCVYRLRTSEDYILKLEFNVFELGTDNQDFIEIYVGSTEVADATFFGRFSHRNSLQGRIVYSTNNQMVIILRSDGRTDRDGRGFSLTSRLFRTPPSTVEVYITLVIGDGVQYIESPGFSESRGELPNYLGTWLFSAPRFSQIIFTLDRSTLLDRDSVVEIFSVTSGQPDVLIVSFRGNDVRFISFISLTESCRVNYRTGQGSHWYSTGFKLGFEATNRDDGGCSQTYFRTSGSASSPGYGLTYPGTDVPVPYPINYDCTYSLALPTGGNFSFWFEEPFGLGEGDQLEVNNVGYNSRMTYTGREVIVPPGQFAATGYIDITFLTNAVTSRAVGDNAGFIVKFSGDCPNLDVTEWTVLSAAAPYQYNKVVDISCMQGYEFQDNDWSGTRATVQCLMDGIWNVTRIPTCQPVFCGIPETVYNGYVSMSEGVLFGNVATYECFDGLDLVGNENVTCQWNKTWSMPPTCSGLVCSLSRPTDGISTHYLRNNTATPLSDPTYGFGAVVELQCAEGYYVEGVTSIYCNGDNQWNGQLGECKRISCYFVPVMDGLMTILTERPHDSDMMMWRQELQRKMYFYQFFTLNGSMVPSLPFESNSTIWCREGFVINNTDSDSASLTCMADGSFGDIPVCVDYDECMDNPCDQMCMNTPGSFYCMCGAEYTLNNITQNTCVLIPGCEANPEACDHQCTSVALPTWFECSCNTPYVLYNKPGAEGWYKHSLDTADEQLRVNQSCVLPQCPLMELSMGLDDKTMMLAHYDDMAYPYHYNDSVKVLCMHGYMFPDGDMEKEFMCGMVGDDLGWFDSDNNSLSSLNCSREAVCDGVVINMNGINFTQPYVQACSSPFSFNITSTCDLDPVTNTYQLFPDVVCPVVDCGLPDIQQTLGSTNIMINCTTMGCSFEFACSDGSQPLPDGAPATVVCMENGKWNFSNIYCEGTTCADPGGVFGAYRYATPDRDPEVAVTLSNLKYGGHLYYGCINYGYELFLKSNGSAVNSTMCDGTMFSPPISDFICKDTMSPEVTSCPAQIEVFRYSMYHGAPFDMGAFLGYGSPQFTDNAGISYVDVTPYSFHYNYTFDENINVTFEAYDFNPDNEPAACHIQFLVVDPVTPVITCSELYIEINATHPEVNVTDAMIMGAVALEGLEWSDLVSYTISVSDQNRQINSNNILSKINQNAVVTVTRVFYSGDVSMGVDRTMNRTVSAQCSVAIIPKPDLCSDDFAPTPGDADRICRDLESGGRECDYTCQDHNAVFFQNTNNLYNTAASQCTNSSVGFTPVLDCIVSGYAVAVSTHAFLMTSGGAFTPSLTCHEALLSGYKNWAISEVCNNSIENITFSDYQTGPTKSLDTLIQFIATPSITIFGFPVWHVVPKENMRGTEVLCNNGAAELRNMRIPSVINLTSIDECLEEAYFISSSIDDIAFVCENPDFTPMEAGQTVIDNVTYPYYSCFNCPRGTYLNGDTCTACPMGTFYPFAGTQTNCLGCPSGSATVDEGSSTCLLECPAGYVSDNGVYPCMPCAVGTYSANSTHCVACPADTMGRSNAQSSSDSCRAMCVPGTYSDDGYAPADGSCTECPVNFYQPNNNSNSCLRCDNNDYTNGLTGQASCVSFQSSCPSTVSTRCASNSCYVYDGLYFCTNFCDKPNEFQGPSCDISISNCDRMLCDPRGASSCADGVCVCNSEIAASGELCDNITLSTPCDSVTCENGGECFVKTTSYEVAATLEAVCLCGGQWSGESCSQVEDKCDSSPCVEGHFSECVSEDVRARCECTEGYMGYTCEIDIDGCDSSPCYNGANCTDVAGTDITNGPFSFTCSCLPGFYGDQCEMRRDECSPDPCGEDSTMCIDDYMSVDSVYCLSEYFNVMVNSTISVSTSSFCQSMDIMCENDAMCSDSEEDRYKCDCSDIYDGIFCQHRIDFCEEGPCGVGNCSNKDDMAGYTCACPPGYSADDGTCENIDECDLDTGICSGSFGICVDTVGSYYCICDEEHAGMNCETNINECMFSTCYGNGTCRDTASDYTCVCNAGRTGENCELEMNQCADQCQYDNQCYPVYGDYVCQCNQPTYGRNCENLPNICETKRPCAYGGDCEVDDLSFTCSDCDEGHAGDSCELWTNECTDNPCELSGMCSLSYGSGYTCECAAGLTGDACNVVLDPCSPDPCPQLSTCVPQGFTDYRCVCPSGYIGEECNVRIDSNFDLYLRIGEWVQVLEPAVSEFWTIGKFTIAAWIRPDRVLNGDGEYIDIIHLTVEGQVVLRVTAHAVIFNNLAYNISTNADLSLTAGRWAFFGVSVHTEDGSSSISIYFNGGAISYSSIALPDEILGRLNVILAPNRDFVGYCSQVYLWAGASFPVSGGSRLNDLLSVDVGEGVYGDEYQGSYILYYWSIGLYRLSPFCEVGRPVRYCTTCEDPDDIIVGTYLEFQRGCPDDIVVDTSSREVAVTWDPPVFLVNGQPLTADTPNILPGSVLPIGRHRVRYSASRNGKSLSCEFKIYVRFGCEGRLIGTRCVRPYEETGLSLVRAVARCLYFGGVLLEVTSEILVEVITTVTNAGLVNRQVIVGSLPGGTNGSQCVTVDSGGSYTGGACISAVGVLCGRPVSSSDSCVLPRIPATVRAVLISASGSRLTKYRLECVGGSSYILPSYAPREITCYPEGNWDTSYGILPGCLPAPVPAVRYRFRLRIRFRIRVRNPCRIGGNSITYRVLFAIRARLRIISTRWAGNSNNIILRSGRSLRLCCDDPANCDTSSSCRSSRFSLSCGCSARAGRRKKRQTGDNVNDIEMSLDELPQTVTSGGESQSPEEAILKAIAANEFTNEVMDDGFNVLTDESPLDGLETVQELDCLDGYVAVDGEECTPCTPGTFYYNGTCEFCPLNTYQDNEAQLSCIDCSGSNITYYTGSTEATDCTALTSAGYFFNANTLVVQPCPVGWFQPNVSRISCEQCPPGTTTVNETSNSTDQCVDLCDSGHEFDSSQSLCVPCSIGLYRDASVSPVCISCPVNYITAMEGSISVDNCTIADCSRGTYRDTTTNQCMGCMRGNYQDMDRQETCINCGGNMTTAAENSTQRADCQLVCPGGYETPLMDPASCQLVAEGYYRTMDIDDPTARGVMCATYFTTQGPGADSEADCNILACPPGMQANGTQDSCESCPINTYSDSITNATTNCTMCDVNYVTMDVGSVGADNCSLSCPDAGEEQYGTSCRSCMKGYYAEDGDEMCSPCNKTLTAGVVAWDTVGEGSTAEDDCTTALCNAGYMRDNSTGVEESCVLCPIGQYQSENSTTVTSCTECPPVGGANQTTEENGSTNVNDCQITCLIGQHDVMDVCVDCPKGFFKNMAGIASCEVCPENFTTDGLGSTDVSNCNVAICGPGYFSDGLDCTECAVGFFQAQDDFIGDTCTFCGSVGDFNKTTASTASKSDGECYVDCMAGYTTDIADGCVPCPENTYDNGTNACVACPSNFTTNGMTGRSDPAHCSHRICAAGEENDVDPGVCVPCPLNEYNPNEMGTCEPCPDSRITMNNGSTARSDCKLSCPAGQQNINETCEACLIGFYKGMEGPEDCVACPTGRTTSDSGATSESDCNKAICEAGEQNAVDISMCEPCPLNTYNPDRMSTCDDCASGEITNGTGKKSNDDCILDCPDGQGYSIQIKGCSPCPKGETRLKSGDSYYCVPCEDGRTTVTIGSTQCEIPMCEQGQYAKNGGVYTCTPCPRNTFQPSSGNQLACVNCEPPLITLSEGTEVKGGCIVRPTCAQRTFTCTDPKHICVDNENDDSECACHTAYDQINDECKHVCSRTGQPFCANDGVCNGGVDDLSLVCTCASDWMGLNCTEPVDFADPDSTGTTLTIVGVVVGVVLLGLIIAAAAGFMKNCGRGVSKTNLYAEELPTAYSGALVPAQAYYPPRGNVGRLQMRGIDELSQRGSPRNYDDANSPSPHPDIEEKFKNSPTPSMLYDSPYMDPIHTTVDQYSTSGSNSIPSECKKPWDNTHY